MVTSPARVSAGKYFDDRVVKRQLALFLEQQMCGGGELFADGADRVARARPGRMILRDIRLAERFRVDRLVVQHHGDRYAGRTAGGQSA